MPQTLHDWLRRHEIDTGLRGVTTEERERIKALEREVKELRRANEILKLASAFFCPGGARPQTQISYQLIDTHKHQYGVEPICKVLQIAPSGYRRHAAQQRNPALRSARVLRDELLMPEIERVWQTNLQVYGADKV